MLFKFKSAAITDTGRHRSVNQDGFFENPSAGLWGVADGMGGHVDGQAASQRIVDSLARIGPQDSLANFVDEVEDRLLAVNRELINLASNRHAGAIIGSTIVALLVCDGYFVSLWAGDSRLYLLRGDQLKQITEDHSRVRELIAAGLLNAEDEHSHPESNIITRALGVSEDLALDMECGELKPGDRFLMCSDGLYREVDERAIGATLANGAPPQVVEELVQRALNNDAKDNVTVVVVDVEASVPGDDQSAGL